MLRTVLIFIPNEFSADKSGFIEGSYENYGHVDAYYITNKSVLSQCKNPIGYVGKFVSSKYLAKNTVFIERGTSIIQINSGPEEQHHISEVYYDFSDMQNSNFSYNNRQYGIHITELNRKLSHNKFKHGNGNKHKFLYWLIYLVNWMITIYSKLKPITKNCATLSHAEHSAKKLEYVLTRLEQDKKLTPRTGNICFAKLIDLILGLCFVYFCDKHQCFIISKLDYISQDFVAHLRQLLIYLMGSPIGLKLNYAFNHSLGRFFFYHINLWRVFLQTMQPLLEANFKLLLLPALFGVSFQVAIICDLISLATFHVYCIYVYAARLFSLQIKGLASLWRLFIGRKSNPLRNRVDSCDYSSNQLFIGTLGFTILLFLLPTTTMYYTVFAAFRLATLFTSSFLGRMKNLLSNVPLYLMILWITRSSSITGAVQLEWMESTSHRTQSKVKLITTSLNETISRFSMGEDSSNENPSVKTIISNICTGQLV